MSETPPHIKRDEMGRRRAAEIHVSAPKCADTNRPISSARHVNVPSETEQTDKCVLTVWTQALKPPSPSNSQTLTGNVCRTTPGGMVCVCVCVSIQLTMFPCSSTELLPETERNTKVDQLCGNRHLHYFSLSLSSVLNFYGTNQNVSTGPDIKH